MQRIVPNLWFDHTAAEAAEFYTSVFPDSRVVHTAHYPTDGLADFQAEFAGQPLSIEFELGGFRLIGINAGPEFRPNPSVSFFVNFDPSADPQAREHLDELWTALAAGGEVRMPLAEYPFSPHYGWVEDKYGVNWQLILTNPEGEPRPFIVPSIMFGQIAQGRAQEAIDFYTSLLDGRVGSVVPWPADSGATAGQVMFADFQLLGEWFATMDAPDQDFTFSCGVSLMLNCEGQEELDRYWEALSAVPESEQCGWCEDMFGLSWQVVPANLDRLMVKPGAFEKLMSMGKIEIEAFR